MKTYVLVLWALAIAISSSTTGNAATNCTQQKRALDRATADYNRAEQQYYRLQFQVDIKSEQGAYRQAMLESNVETARANLMAAEQGGIGQGLGCFFATRAGCVGPTVNRVIQQIARAKAMVRSQEGRLNSYVRAYNQQMTRLSQRVAQQERIVARKRIELGMREKAYEACLAG